MIWAGSGVMYYTLETKNYSGNEEVSHYRLILCFHILADILKAFHRKAF